MMTGVAERTIYRYMNKDDNNVKEIKDYLTELEDEDNIIELDKEVKRKILANE